MKASHSRSGTTRATGLIAAGSLCAVLASPAHAVQLGDIAMESALGQPLRASIAVALGPNERLTDDCVYLRAAGMANGLPAITRARATVAGNRIVLRGNTPLNEPLMSLTLAVDCPYTANLQREYLLMLAPPTTVADRRPARDVQTAATQAPRRDVRRPVNVFEPAPATPREPAPAAAAPLAAGSRYRVRVGDTVSDVAARLPDRRMALWPAVDAIFAANPQAFVNGDVDRLIAGAVLTIPASVATGNPAPAPSALADTPAGPATSTTAATTTRAYGGAREGLPATTGQAATPAEPADPVPATEPVEPAGPATAATPPAAAPDTAATNADAAPVETRGEVADTAPAAASAPPEADVVVSIPDTEILQPGNAPIPLGEASGESSAQNWLVWLGGSGIAIFLGLLLFGRRLRERFGAATEQPDDLDTTQVNREAFSRRSSDRGEPDSNAGIDIADTLGHADEVSMPQPDTDVFGDTGDDVDVALDYSFATSGEYENPVDFEVGSDAHGEQGIEPVGVDDEAARTREMPARADSTAEAATGNYDMSMVIDATKQDFGTGRRPRNLNAIEVEALDSRPRKAPSLDLTTEFDYKILEQDYEEELTATQALTRDIEVAARELQQRLGEYDDDEDTSRLSLAEDLDGTAEVKADVMSGDATAENQALDDTDIGSMAITAQLPQADDTAEMAADDDDDDDMDETVERRSRAG